MESLNQAIEDARSRYVEANPLSLAADQRAETFMPGGNTLGDHLNEGVSSGKPTDARIRFDTLWRTV